MIAAICFISVVLLYNSTCEAAQTIFDEGIGFAFSDSNQAMSPVVGKMSADPQTPVSPEESIHLEMIRLRVSWGGGQPFRLRGKISIDSGSFADPAVLGLAPDASGSAIADSSDLHLYHRSPAQFGGVDVTIHFRPGSKLKIDLTDDSVESIEWVDQVDVLELIDQNYVLPLDATGNRLVISRLDSDRVPVRIDRPHLIFEPGEEFEFWIRANRCGIVSKQMNGWLRLEPVKRSKGGKASTSGIHRLTAVFNPPNSLGKIDLGVFQLDDTGSSDEHRVQVQLPDQEGVYQLTIEINTPWQSGSQSATLRRNIEFVILSRESRNTFVTDTELAWKGLVRINPASDLFPQPLWQNNLKEMGRMTGLTEDRYWSSQNIGRRNVDDKELIEIPPGGWLAIAVNTDNIDQPHKLEVEYLAGQPMAVGISILEPNSNGQVPYFGADSGIFQPKSLIDSEGKSSANQLKQHGLIFWPKQKKNYVLIANRNRHHPAVIGSIGVLLGPERLLPSPSVNQLQVPDRSIRREFLAFYESPLFVQNFGADQPLEEHSGQRLDDWLTFYQGADRLIQYLKSTGHTGAMIAVACDGSSLYPSQTLGSTPKLDSGIFFRNGQDPMRKDVVELLMRMFERENLTLIPALTFSSPLPQVERFMRTQSLADEASQNSVSIGLVSFQGITAGEELKHQLPIYNPLHPMVQQAVTEEIATFSRRYSGHPSFAGLAIICRPDSYSLLPGQNWLYDSHTLERFWATASTASSDGKQPPETWFELQNRLAGEGQLEWLNWRAENLHRWYRQMLQQIRSEVPEGRLIIAPVDVYRNEELQMALAPNLHISADFQRQMLRIGWVAEHFAQTPGLDLLRPRRIAPNDSLASRRVEIGLESQRQVDEFYHRAASIGDLFSHRNAWAHFGELQQQTPFLNQQGSLMRLQPLVPSGHFNRQRFLNSFRSGDPQFWIDGGWQLPMGQETELRDLITSFRQLPNQPFEDVPLAMGQQRWSQVPILLRQYQNGQQTWLYAVNPSPWPVKALIEIEVEDGIQDFDANSLEFFSMPANPLRIQPMGQKIAVLELELEPLSFLAARAETPIYLAAYQYSVPENSADRLRKLVYSLQAKLNLAANARPLESLKNASFEQSSGSSMPGWSLGLHDQAEVRVESEGSLDGGQHLRVENRSQQPIWIRSHPIPVPETGRLSVSAWLKTTSPDQQPPLRISIEGVISDSHYYRFGSVGQLSSNPQSSQLGKQWQRFAVHFDDLPVEGISDLRIGFDLMGEGEVQIDHLEVYDRWFDERDAKAITQRLASCGPLLANPATYENGRLLLQSYWLQFLDEHFGHGNATANQMNRLPVNENRTNSGSSQQARSDPEEVRNSRGNLRRLRRQTNRQ